VQGHEKGQKTNSGGNTDRIKNVDRQKKKKKESGWVGRGAVKNRSTRRCDGIWKSPGETAQRPQRRGTWGGYGAESTKKSGGKGRGKKKTKHSQGPKGEKTAREKNDVAELN